MAYYPICLDISQRPCVVVGGGRVAYRKVKGLLEAGAAVTVISPEIQAEIEACRQDGHVEVQLREYRSGDLDGAFLVISATDDPQVQQQVHRDAEKCNVLLNVADVPELCNFILPARVQRGDLSIAISTGGSSPALAKQLRQRLEKQFGSEYARYLRVLALLRPLVLAKGLAQPENEALFHALVKSDLFEAVCDNDVERIVRVINEQHPGLIGDGERREIVLALEGR